MAYSLKGFYPSRISSLFFLVSFLFLNSCPGDLTLLAYTLLYISYNAFVVFSSIWQLFHWQLLSCRCFTRIYIGLACIRTIVIHRTCHYYSSVVCLRDVNIINLVPSKSSFKLICYQKKFEWDQEGGILCIGINARFVSLIWYAHIWRIIKLIGHELVALYYIFCLLCIVGLHTFVISSQNSLLAIWSS